MPDSAVQGNVVLLLIAPILRCIGLKVVAILWEPSTAVTSGSIGRPVSEAGKTMLGFAGADLGDSSGVDVEPNDPMNSRFMTLPLPLPKW